MLLLTGEFVRVGINPDVIPVGVIVFGGAMSVVIMLIHGAGLDRIVNRYKKKAEMLRKKKRHPKLAAFVFGGTILLMLLLHMAETCLWGVVLNRAGLVPNVRNAIYFAANTYTTLAYGDMLLPHNWRELSPIIAMSGLFTFAWTTSELFNVVGYQHDLQNDLSSRRHKEATGEPMNRDVSGQGSGER